MKIAKKGLFFLNKNLIVFSILALSLLSRKACTLHSLNLIRMVLDIIEGFKTFTTAGIQIKILEQSSRIVCFNRLGLGNSNLMT